MALANESLGSLDIIGALKDQDIIWLYYPYLTLAGFIAILPQAIIAFFLVRFAHHMVEDGTGWAWDRHKTKPKKNNANAVKGNKKRWGFLGR